MGIGAYASVIFSMSELQKSLTLPHLYPFLVAIHLSFLPAVEVLAVFHSARRWPKRFD